MIVLFLVTGTLGVINRKKNQFSNNNAFNLFIATMLQISFLHYLIEGIETCRRGHQSSSLIFSKRIDAICRSLPSIALQLFSLGIGISSMDRQRFIIFGGSIGVSILFSSHTLSNLHGKSGNHLFVYQKLLCLTYYVSEILVRTLSCALGFLALRGFCLCLLVPELILRWYFIRNKASEHKDEIKLNLIEVISYAFLYAGSDYALEEQIEWHYWFRGSCLVFFEAVDVFKKLCVFF